MNRGASGERPDVLLALRGALAFLSRLPVGGGERAWDAFRTTPFAFPLAGYVLGGLLALALLGVDALSSGPTVALVLVAGVYLLTGIAHADGVADLGDAAAAHGSGERRAALADAAVGAGGALALALVVAALALAGLALAGLPRRAFLLVIAAEVSAKLGMAALACLGAATHEGLGAAFTAPNDPRALAGAVLVALPAAALMWPRPAAGLALLAGIVAALAVGWWARSTLGGVSGDAFGAANEIARVAALHAGVIAWTPS
jgi:adenosylcobinamide-GDP ribazoletransferase